MKYRKRKVVSEEKIETALRNNDGVAVYAARELDMNLRTLWNYIRRSKYLRKVLDEYRGIPRKQRRPDTTLDEVEAALRSTGGFQTQAAELLGITQGAVAQRIRKYTRLQNVVDEIQEQYCDLGESKLIELIQKGDFQAIRFYLKCKGKDRGYVEDHNLNLNSGQDTIWKVERVIVRPKNKNTD